MCRGSRGRRSSLAEHAAVLAKALCRTVSVVATTADSTVAGAHGEAATRTRSAREPAGTESAAERSDDDHAAGIAATSPEALRAAKASQRKRKKEWRRAAKVTASTAAEVKDETDERSGWTLTDLPGLGGGPSQPASGADTRAASPSFLEVASRRVESEPPRKRAKDNSGSVEPTASTANLGSLV